MQQADQQAVELQLSMEVGTRLQKVEKVIELANSARRNRYKQGDGVKAARFAWHKAIAVQQERKQKMLDHKLHPVELIKMKILDIKIKAARVRTGKHGNAIGAVRPNSLEELDLTNLEEYITTYNTKHGTAFTLAGTLWEYFGDVHDIVSFLFIVQGICGGQRVRY
uniref:RxLR effector candidate protein n=1 Tax=Hyaloperonospora arabidopsidis (strain Emoy2) TaxID=559515 RepID=M4B4D0_HYAAE